MLILHARVKLKNLKIYTRAYLHNDDYLYICGRKYFHIIFKHQSDMIKILEQTPIIVDGSHRVELLILDTDGDFPPCSRCCYKFDPYTDDEECCFNTHNCNLHDNAFFIIV